MVTKSKQPNRAAKAVPKKVMKCATAKKPAPLRTPTLRAHMLSGSHKEALQAVLAAETPTDMRPLKFALAPGATAKYVSATIRSTAFDQEPDKIVMINGQSWPSQPRPKGRRVKLEIHIEGNPGAAATINVTNGTPKTIAVDVPAGNTGWIHSRLVKADWP